VLPSPVKSPVGDLAIAADAGYDLAVADVNLPPERFQSIRLPPPFCAARPTWCRRCIPRGSAGTPQVSMRKAIVILAGWSTIHRAGDGPVRLPDPNGSSNHRRESTARADGEVRVDSRTAVVEEARQLAIAGQDLKSTRPFHPSATDPGYGVVRA